MLGRRRMLAAALAVMAYPVGVAFAQPVPFRPPMPAPRREVRPPRRADPAPGIGHEVGGDGMAANGFGRPGAGGAEWAGAALQVGRADRPGCASRGRSPRGPDDLSGARCGTAGQNASASKQHACVTAETQAIRGLERIERIFSQISFS